MISILIRQIVCASCDKCHTNSRKFGTFCDRKSVFSILKQNYSIDFLQIFTHYAIFALFLLILISPGFDGVFDFVFRKYHFF